MAGGWYIYIPCPELGWHCTHADGAMKVSQECLPMGANSSTVPFFGPCAPCSPPPPPLPLTPAPLGPLWPFQLATTTITATDTTLLWLCRRVPGQVDQVKHLGAGGADGWGGGLSRASPALPPLLPAALALADKRRFLSRLCFGLRP